MTTWSTRPGSPDDAVPFDTVAGDPGFDPDNDAVDLDEVFDPWPDPSREPSPESERPRQPPSGDLPRPALSTPLPPHRPDDAEPLEPPTPEGL